MSTINRRTFLAGTAAIAAAPTVPLAVTAPVETYGVSPIMMLALAMKDVNALDIIDRKRLSAEFVKVMGFDNE